MTRVRKWLGGSVTLSVTLRWHRWELLAIALIVIILSIFWPSAPLWVFLIVGAVIGLSDVVARDVGHWLRRRRAA